MSVSSQGRGHLMLHYLIRQVVTEGTITLNKQNAECNILNFKTFHKTNSWFYLKNGLRALIKTIVFIKNDTTISRNAEWAVWEFQAPYTYIFPLMQVGKVYLSICINMLPSFYCHRTSGFNKTNWGVERVGVQQPQANWDIVCVT